MAGRYPAQLKQSFIMMELPKRRATPRALKGSRRFAEHDFKFERSERLRLRLGIQPPGIFVPPPDSEPKLSG